MKILLVYPQCPDTFWNFKHALKFISKKAGLAPLGLLTVASMLPKEWEKKVVDTAMQPLTDQDLIWADFVFISAMFIQKLYVTKIVEKCKQFNKKIVAGGPLFTGAMDYFQKDIDHLILNEAEITLPLFLADLQAGHPKHIYTSEVKPELLNTPIPSWELIDQSKYAFMSIQFSRGCPFRCDFCDVTALFGHRMRVKTTEQILAEMENLYMRDWRDGVFFVDDNFIGNKSILKKQVLPAMVEWMQKRNYPFALNTQVSINLADDEELMSLMVQAGFNMVFIGIETTEDLSLEECSKSQNQNRDMLACVKKIQKFGLQVQAGFILGFDHDESSTFQKLTDFIQESGIVTAMVGLLNAPRGSGLYHRLVKENRLLGDATGDNTDYSLNFIPKMDREELINGYKSVVSTIYSPKQYYQRINTLMETYRPLKKKSYHKGDIRALVKSMWSLGIREKGRSYYWRLLLWSIFFRPELFETCITHAIYGFHFRKMFVNN